MVNIQTSHLRLYLPDRSYSSFIKKEIRKIAEQAQFPEYRLSELDIVVSEIITNLIKHAKEGELLVKVVYKNEIAGLEIISIDKGPGMRDPLSMMKDGSSTTRTLGQGLGSIKRLSDEFDIYSIRGWGTILLSRIYSSRKLIVIDKEHLSIDAVMIPKSGEDLCGDGWAIIKHKLQYRLLALDGLGHGPEANKASAAAIKYFDSDYLNTPSETLKLMHQHIKSTRGAVGMIFSLEPVANSLSFCGIGNISARIMGNEKARNCISYNGIIGYSMPNTVHNNMMMWNKEETILIHSDGLKSRWDIAHLPNIDQHDGSILAAALYKDFSRGTDDILIIAVNRRKK